MLYSILTDQECNKTYESKLQDIGQGFKFRNDQFIKEKCNLNTKISQMIKCIHKKRWKVDLKPCIVFGHYWRGGINFLSRIILMKNFVSILKHS